MQHREPLAAKDFKSPQGLTWLATRVIWDNPSLFLTPVNLPFHRSWLDRYRNQDRRELLQCHNKDYFKLGKHLCRR